MRTHLAAVLGLSLLVARAFALPSVSIDIANLQIRNATNQTRSSAQPIDASLRYAYHFSENTLVRGNGGVLGILYPSPTPLATVLEALQPGSAAALSGAGNNPGGTLPVTLPTQTIDTTTTLSGINVHFAVTTNASISAGGIVSFSLTNVIISPSILVGSFLVTQGSVIVDAICAADYVADGAVTIDDLIAVLVAFEAGDVSLDYTGDQAVTIDDLLVFLAHFEGGC